MTFKEWKEINYGENRNSGYDQFESYAKSAWQFAESETAKTILDILESNTHYSDATSLDSIAIYDIVTFKKKIKKKYRM